MQFKKKNLNIECPTTPKKQTLEANDRNSNPFDPISNVKPSSASFVESNDVQFIEFEEFVPVVTAPEPVVPPAPSNKAKQFKFPATGDQLLKQEIEQLQQEKATMAERYQALKMKYDDLLREYSSIQQKQEAVAIDEIPDKKQIVKDHQGEKGHRQQNSITQGELLQKMADLIRQNNQLAQENASLQYQNLVLKNEVEQNKNRMFLNRIDGVDESAIEPTSHSFDINKTKPAISRNVNSVFNNDVIQYSETSLSQRKAPREPINTYFKTSMPKTNFYIENIKVHTIAQPSKSRLEALKVKKDDLKLSDFQNYFATNSPKDSRPQEFKLKLTTSQASMQNSPNHTFNKQKEPYKRESPSLRIPNYKEQTSSKPVYNMRYAVQILCKVQISAYSITPSRLFRKDYSLILNRIPVPYLSLKKESINNLVVPESLLDTRSNIASQSNLHNLKITMNSNQHTKQPIQTMIKKRSKNSEQEIGKTYRNSWKPELKKS